MKRPSRFNPISNAVRSGSLNAKELLEFSMIAFLMRILATASLGLVAVELSDTAPCSIEAPQSDEDDEN